jgi:hypothetical protein
MYCRSASVIVDMLRGGFGDRSVGLGVVCIRDWVLRRVVSVVDCGLGTVKTRGEQ